MAEEVKSQPSIAPAHEISGIQGQLQETTVPQEIVEMGQNETRVVDVPMETAEAPEANVTGRNESIQKAESLTWHGR